MRSVLPHCGKQKAIMLKRHQHKLPGLNTTATADISFMLLIFFLVTSSMDSDWGMQRLLPPPVDSLHTEELVVSGRNLLEVRLDSMGRCFVDDRLVATAELMERVDNFVCNPEDLPGLPEKTMREVSFFGRCAVSDRHVILLKISPEATYESYFSLQNTLMAAYARGRNRLARQHFGRPYAACTPQEREAVNMVLPQRISEEVGTGEDSGAQVTQKGGPT